jgi:hypothetical protein
MVLVRSWDDMPVETSCVHPDEAYEGTGPITPYTDAIIFAVDHTIGYPASTDSPPRIVADVCDLSVTVSIRGAARQASYMNFGGLYTGWDVTGTITVESSGHDPLLVQVVSAREPPDTVRYGDESDAPRRPADAIIDASRRGDWCSAFVALFRPSSGTQQFMPLLCSP